MTIQRSFQSLRFRIGGFVMLAAITGLVFLATRGTGTAQQVQRRVFEPFEIAASHTVRLNVLNTANRPMGIRLHVLKATDLSPLASSAPVLMNPRTGGFFEYQTTSNAFVAPAIEVSGPGDLIGSIRMSVQAKDSAGSLVAPMMQMNMQ